MTTAYDLPKQPQKEIKQSRRAKKGKKPKLLRKSLDSIFKIKKSTTPFALLMYSNADGARELINAWSKRLSKNRKKKLDVNDIVHALAMSPNQSTNTATVAVPALWVAQNLDVIFASSGTSANDSEELVNLLWNVASNAQAASAVDHCVTKSLGIELGITLCLQLVHGHPKSGMDLIHENHLQEEFESLVESQLDGDGWPESSLLSNFGVIAASWLRSYMILNSLSSEVDYEIVLLLEWLVRQLLRMRRRNGTLCFGPEIGLQGIQEFWTLVKSASSDDDDRIIYKAVANPTKLSKTKLQQKVRQANNAAEAFNLSEWSRSALLRNDWNPHSPILGINFSRPANHSMPVCEIDLSGKHRMVFGNTFPQIEIDAKPTAWPGNFEVICDRFDDDLDYIEIQAELTTDQNRTESGTLNRQFLLSRNDEFLLVIDTVIPPDCQTAKRIQYQCDWPLAENVEPLQETETREVYFQSREKRRIFGLGMPIGQPEWKGEKFDGSWKITDRAIRLEQFQTGSGLVVPVLFDLNAKRSKQKRTWHRLTVAQDRKTVPPDHAVAIRFQLNESQYFFLSLGSDDWKSDVHGRKYDRRICT